MSFVVIPLLSVHIPQCTHSRTGALHCASPGCRLWPDLDVTTRRRYVSFKPYISLSAHSLFVAMAGLVSPQYVLPMPIFYDAQIYTYSFFQLGSCSPTSIALTPILSPSAPPPPVPAPVTQSVSSPSSGPTPLSATSTASSSLSRTPSSISSVSSLSSGVSLSLSLARRSPSWNGQGLQLFPVGTSQ